MILIGQYDSPFVRRVAVALKLYGISYEHRPWSTFGDVEKLAAYNPLRRVPTVVLNDGEVLIESAVILDHLDERVGASRAMMAGRGAARRSALKVCALATGLCDKMVSLVYEHVLHETVSVAWTTRCKSQIGGVLDALEHSGMEPGGPYWFGEGITHADIALTCAMRFLKEAHPDIHRLDRWPRIATLASRCEALEAFSAVVQPFDPPFR